VNPTEIATRINALPEQYAGRFDSQGLEDVRAAARAGEWGEALDILVCALARTQTLISQAEYIELEQLLDATGTRTVFKDKLAVQWNPPS
jgi:ornithine cyclodeaminase/alanine dehydrogenase-like protein (mu-crystallin family)